MPRSSATDELAKLERRVHEVRRERGEAHAQAEQLHTQLGELREQRVAAFARDDEHEADRLAETIARREAETERAAAKLAGLDQRLRLADEDVKRFIEEHGVKLVKERSQVGRKLAGELTAAVQLVLDIHRALLAERSVQDRLLAEVSGLESRRHGPPPTHAWEPALRELERAVRQNPELTAPLPRLPGLRERAEEEQRKRVLRRQREEADAAAPS